MVFRDESGIYIAMNKKYLLFISIFLIFCGNLFAGEDPYKEKREEMVKKQLAARDINNKRVLEVMKEIPRHEFVPTYFKKLAYRDHPLPIGSNQTISQPYIVALMTQVLDPKPTDKVLEIGTGSGYQAAVLAKLAKEVYSIEIVKRLGEEAAERLKKLGYSNVHVKVGDGYFGWPEAAPFDGIIITAAAGFVPPALIKQLAEGGRFILPLGDAEAGHQLLTLITKKDGKLEKKYISGVRFVPMTGKILESKQEK